MISVVICTYNRAEALKLCLESFTHIDFAKPWELIVVDNNSSDATQKVIEKIQHSTDLPVRTVLEQKQGLGYARNRGLAESQYPIVAYTDDDCYPQADYLTQISKNFSEHDISFVGGRVLLFDPTDLELTVQFSTETVFFEPTTYMRAGVIHGANFAFKRDLLIEANGFDPNLGAGSPFKAGEDTDLLAECQRLGARGKYAPEIVVSHHHGRKSQEDFISLKHSYDIGRGAFYAKRLFFCSGGKLRTFKNWFFCIRNQPWSMTKTELKYASRYTLQRLQNKLDYEPRNLA
ncbi:glycosyltransferase [Salinimonas chungwhensis]|uniref:glycosyltransferase n=1 Tax=Salinimonas chungwhensis TaxID=265425 RepID=UPI00035D622B|nr:glycosyltransferase family A protein [Salinimonas chungwhensis]